MSTDTRPTIDLESWDDGRQPTRAVAAAALLLGDADTTDATCYGWVPQAHAALAAALDVEEMARVLADHRTRGIEVAGGVRRVWCVCGWDTTEDPAREAREAHIAAALRAAILGEETKTDA